MKPVLEVSHHAEVPASTANCPEKVWIGLLASFDLPPVHGHYPCRYQVVAGGAVLRHQGALASAERQLSESDAGASAHRSSQAEMLCRFVQLAHQTACFRTR